MTDFWQKLALGRECRVGAVRISAKAQTDEHPSVVTYVMACPHVDHAMTRPILATHGPRYSLPESVAALVNEAMTEMGFSEFGMPPCGCFEVLVFRFGPYLYPSTPDKELRN